MSAPSRYSASSDPAEGTGASGSPAHRGTCPATNRPAKAMSTSISSACILWAGIGPRVGPGANPCRHRKPLSAKEAESPDALWHDWAMSLSHCSARETKSVVLGHLDAFNDHNTVRLLAGFAPTAVWATGMDVFRGPDQLANLFSPDLWSLSPSLALRRLIVNDAEGAAELHEELTVDGEVCAFDIAVFFRVSSGLIEQAKVYREGVADLD